jgi:hypothetical protein
VAAKAREDEGLEAARAAKAKALRVFQRFAPVCGVGLTRRRGVHCIKVNLEVEPASPEELPDEIDNVPVIVHVVGKIRKQGRAAAR